MDDRALDKVLSRLATEDIIHVLLGLRLAFNDAADQAQREGLANRIMRFMQENHAEMKPQVVTKVLSLMLRAGHIQLVQVQKFWKEANASMDEAMVLVLDNSEGMMFRPPVDLVVHNEALVVRRCLEIVSKYGSQVDVAKVWALDVLTKIDLVRVYEAVCWEDIDVVTDHMWRDVLVPAVKDEDRLFPVLFGLCKDRWACELLDILVQKQFTFHESPFALKLFQLAFRNQRKEALLCINAKNCGEIASFTQTEMIRRRHVIGDSLFSETWRILMQHLAKDQLSTQPTKTIARKTFRICDAKHEDLLLGTMVMLHLILGGEEFSLFLDELMIGKERHTTTRSERENVILGLIHLTCLDDDFTFLERYVKLGDCAMRKFICDALFVMIDTERITHCSQNLITILTDLCADKGCKVLGNIWALLLLVNPDALESPMKELLTFQKQMNAETSHVSNAWMEERGLYVLQRNFEDPPLGESVLRYEVCAVWCISCKPDKVLAVIDQIDTISPRGTDHRCRTFTLRYILNSDSSRWSAKIVKYTLDGLNQLADDILLEILPMQSMTKLFHTIASRRECPHALIDLLRRYNTLVSFKEPFLRDMLKALGHEFVQEPDIEFCKAFVSLIRECSEGSSSTKLVSTMALELVCTRDNFEVGWLQEDLIKKLVFTEPNEHSLAELHLLATSKILEHPTLKTKHWVIRQVREVLKQLLILQSNLRQQKGGGGEEEGWHSFFTKLSEVIARFVQCPDQNLVKLERLGLLFMEIFRKDVFEPNFRRCTFSPKVEDLILSLICSSPQIRNLNRTGSPKDDHADFDGNFVVMEMNKALNVAAHLAKHGTKPSRKAGNKLIDFVVGRLKHSVVSENHANVQDAKMKQVCMAIDNHLKLQGEMERLSSMSDHEEEYDGLDGPQCDNSEDEVDQILSKKRRKKQQSSRFRSNNPFVDAGLDEMRYECNSDGYEDLEDFVVCDDDDDYGDQLDIKQMLLHR